uniref:Sulfotransferase domain-containing protein n=1 Tax=Alexandrium catenella TaxID=2925 RepID=A0A7S1LNF7_ALECA
MLRLKSQSWLPGAHIPIPNLHDHRPRTDRSVRRCALPLVNSARRCSAFSILFDPKPLELDSAESGPSPGTPPPGSSMRRDEEGAETWAEVEWPCETTPNKQLPGRCRSTVWWLHAPKTGTSFTASQMRCRCTPGWEPRHAPMPRNVTDGDLRTVIAMFREPRERLMSVYMYIQNPRYHCGPGEIGCSRDWGWDEQTEAAAKSDILAGRPPGEVLGRFQGCYANMIAGKRGCMSGELPRGDEVLEAERRVGLFRFVGLTRHWRLSVCLFNFLTEGKRFVTGAQVQNSRPTHSQNGTSYDTSGMPHDPADGQIYEAVTRRFWNEVHEHGITERSCPME